MDQLSNAAPIPCAGRCHASPRAYNSRHTPCGCGIIILSGLETFLSLLSHLPVFKAAQAHAGGPLSTIIKDAMKNLKTISISVISSVITIIIILYIRPFSYFTVAPSEKWWTALSIIVAISFAVIAISITVLLRERESKERLASLEKKLKEDSTFNRESYENILGLISNLLEVQEVTETQSHEHWTKVQNNIKGINSFGLLTSFNLRTWSILAWKQGNINATRTLREKAYQLDSNDFRNRVMLCNILTQDKKPDKTKIENILNKIDLKSDNIVDEDKDHFYNIKGMYYKKIGQIKKASESFKNSLEFNIQTWPFYEYIITLIMREDITNTYIKKEIKKLESIPNSKWLDDKVLYQKAFRLFANCFINKSEINKFYNYLTPLTISKLVYEYNNQYDKMKFFNFYSHIIKKYNDKELNTLYLTFYKLLGVYDDQADNELQKQENA